MKTQICELCKLVYPFLLLIPALSLYYTVGMSSYTPEKLDHLRSIMQEHSYQNKTYTYESVTYDFLEYMDPDENKYFILPEANSYVDLNSTLKTEPFEFSPDNLDYTVGLSQGNTLLRIAVKDIEDPNLEYKKIRYKIKKNNCTFLYLRWDKGIIDPAIEFKEESGVSATIDLGGFTVKRQPDFNGTPNQIIMEKNVNETKNFRNKAKFFYVMCPFFKTDNINVEIELSVVIGAIEVPEETPDENPEPKPDEPANETPDPSQTNSQNDSSDNDSTVDFPEPPKNELELIEENDSLSNSEKTTKQSELLESYFSEVLSESDDKIIKIQENESDSTQNGATATIEKTDNVFQTQKVEIETDISIFLFLIFIIFKSCKILK